MISAVWMAIGEHLRASKAWEEDDESMPRASARTRKRNRWECWIQKIEKKGGNGERIRLAACQLDGMEEEDKRQDAIVKVMRRRAISDAPADLRRGAAKALVEVDELIMEAAQTIDPGTQAACSYAEIARALGTGSGTGWCEAMNLTISLDQIRTIESLKNDQKKTIEEETPWLAWRILCTAPKEILSSERSEQIEWIRQKTVCGEERRTGEHEEDAALEEWPWPEHIPPLAAAAGAYRQRSRLEREEWENAAAAVQRKPWKRSPERGIEEARSERTRARKIIERWIEKNCERWWKRIEGNNAREKRKRFEEARNKICGRERYEHMRMRLSPTNGLMWEVQMGAGDAVFAWTQAGSINNGQNSKNRAIRALERGGWLGLAIHGDGATQSITFGEHATEKGRSTEQAKAMIDAITRALNP